MREVEIYGSINSPKITGLPGILPKDDLHSAVHGARLGFAAADILHFDSAIYVAYGEVADHIANAHPSGVHGSELQVHAARDLELEVHLDHVAVVAVPAASAAAIAITVAIAAKGPVDVELQQVWLVGDIERHFLLSGVHSFLGFRTNGFVDHQLHLVGLPADHFDGAENIVDVQEFVRRAHAEGLADSLLLPYGHGGVVVAMAPMIAHAGADGGH